MMYLRLASNSILPEVQPVMYLVYLLDMVLKMVLEFRIRMIIVHCQS